MSSKLLIGNGCLITLGDNNKIIEAGGVYIEENLIKDFGKTSLLKKKYSNAKFIDASGKIIMPGLICAHHHLYSTFACGISSKPSENFVKILENLWWRLDKALTLDDVYYSSLIPLIKCIKSGTTTIIDHHASPKAIKGSLNKIAQACQEIGVRACLCYELTDRGGEKEANEGIEENIEFIKKYKDFKNEMISGMFGMHASFTLSDKTIKKAVEAMGNINAGFHIHIAEDKADVDDSIQKYNKTVVERLNDLGILGEKSIAAHCIHINEKEIEILAETKTNVVNNPSSNMNNAVGTADILKMIKNKVTVGLGTDGMTSNMFEEVKIAYLIQHHFNKDPRVAFTETIEMLLKTNSKIASKYFKHKVGVIEKDAYADIIIVDYYPYTPLKEENFYGHFLFGIAGCPVDTTIVNGKIIMQNKKLKNINEKEIYNEAQKFAQKVWKRF
jgi:putative selenium metabolism protein SsnA